jgi:hypothetical protein
MCVRAPSAATVVTAPVHGTPRRAWRASTTGRQRPEGTWAWHAGSRRWRRALGSVTARTSAWQTIGGAGGDRRLQRGSPGAAGRPARGAWRPCDRASPPRGASVRRHAVAWWLRDARGGDHPADAGLLGELAGEPSPTGSGLIDHEQRRSLRLECADQGLEGTRPRVPRTTPSAPRASELSATAIASWCPSRPTSLV